ncbi:MAG: DUF3305 domain-containing protein [Filomicrobium sp.]
MASAAFIPIGIVVAREHIGHPWQAYRWRPVSVFLDAPKIANWRELRKDGKNVLYHAATLELELHRRETTAYQVNLANGEPTVYVVLREDHEAGGDWPVDVHLVTVSPFEAQSHSDVGFDSVEGVAMPERLVENVQQFIDLHHQEEKFYKRKRQPHMKAEEYKFGQEPIVSLRERQGSPFEQEAQQPQAAPPPNGNGGRRTR